MDWEFSSVCCPLLTYGSDGLEEQAECNLASLYRWVHMYTYLGIFKGIREFVNTVIQA